MEKITTSKEWETTFDAISDPVSIHDMECNLVKVNQAFADMVKQDKVSLIGKKCFEVIHNTSEPSPNCPHMKTLENNVPFKEIILESNLGKFLEISTSPIFYGKNKSYGSVHIIKDITNRTMTEFFLKDIENISKRQVARELTEKNTAVQVLLKQLRNSKNEIGENVISNIKSLVMPYIIMLKNSKLSSKDIAYLNNIESNLNNIISPFANTLSSAHYNFSPKELQIAQLIRDGIQDKEIAEILCLSLDTVKTHRKHIRKKLGISGRKINLRSNLLSMNT